MNSETTDNQESQGGDLLLYDGDCVVCSFLAARARPSLLRQGCVARPAGRDLSAVLLVRKSGERVGGSEAMLILARKIWWARPIRLFLYLPGGRLFINWAYRAFAARRRSLPAIARSVIGALLLSIAVIALRLAPLPPWGLMWTLAISIFAGCKWLTWHRETRQNRRPVSRLGKAAYLYLWPGMDARAFLRSRPSETVTPSGASLRNIFVGAILLWMVPKASSNPFAAGWIGMTGLVLFLHFGFFALLASFWQVFGFNAQPIMKAPLHAVSLSEFWGKRWNAAFNRLAHSLVFQPVARRYGLAAGTLTAFAASGLIHDLVISLPAGAGFGLPTSYFLLQGAGVLAERSRAGRAVGLARGIRGRFFTLVMTAGPAVLLFHPPFVTRVMVPFMKAIHAL